MTEEVPTVVSLETLAQVPDSSQSYNTAGSTPENSHSNESHIEHRNTYLLQNALADDSYIIKRSNQFLTDNKWDLFSKTYPSLSPFGRGALNEERLHPMSLSTWVLRCLRLRNHRFERHHAFIGMAFDKLSMKNSYSKLFASLTVSKEALAAGTLTTEIIKIQTS